MVIKKQSVFAMIIVLFPLCYLFRNIEVLSYYDELVGMIATAYVIMLLLKGQLIKNDLYICICLTIITIIGAISNIVSGITSNIFAIVVDAMWLWKTFACYIAFKYIGSRPRYREEIVRNLVFLAKFSIIIIFATSIIGEVINIGVTSDYTLYGIRQFVFWGNSLQAGWLLFCALLILASYNIGSSRFRRYYIMAIIPAILTFSSLIYCFFFVATVLLLILRESTVFKKKYIVLLAVGIALFTFADIQNYFMSDSVRMKLIQGGIITANKYFPLGSGFATYGSEMASRYYSQVYVDLGWENMWGLGRTYNQYLNDNFFAGILGEFGYIGFLVYLFALYFLFKEANSILLNRRERCIAVAIVLTIAVVMIGSASAKSVMGVCTFSVLGIICSKNIYLYDQKG